MTLPSLFEKTKQELNGILDFYKKDIATIRTGRATPSLVEDIIVDYYDQKLHIKELASITVPEPRTLVIQPWDKNSLEAISGALQKSTLGINPVVDGQAVRLHMPQLSEERRKEFIKNLNHKTEEARIKVRQIRENTWNEIQKMEKKSEITEDDKFTSKDNLQKLVDDFNNQLKAIESKKETELMN